jgi:hypothetical protein
MVCRKQAIIRMVHYDSLAVLELRKARAQPSRMSGGLTGLVLLQCARVRINEGGSVIRLRGQDDMLEARMQCQVLSLTAHYRNPSRVSAVWQERRGGRAKVDLRGRYMAR